jgi:Sec-independent protein secretion pathway component TatC
VLPVLLWQLPGALAFLVGFDDHLYDVQIRASYCYSFVSLTLLAVGLAFQLPIFVLALTRLAFSAHEGCGETGASST